MAEATLAGRALLLTDGARRGLNSQAFRWAIAPSIAAWASLIAFAASGAEPAFCVAPTRDAVHGFARTLGASLASVDPGAVAFAWGLMLVAMMGPLLVPMITYVAARSFVDRRDRAVGLFATGYAAVWMAAAVVAFFMLLLLRTLSLYAGVGLLGSLLGVVAAAVWQLSELKQRALNRCHGVRPLRANGFAADRDAFSFGLLHGSRCVCACAPTMFLTMFGGHPLMTMAVVFTVLMAERTASKPRQSGAAALLLLTGFLAAPLV
jgi:predicted metal-binding membrane protein